jgi:flagellar biosynthesis chaperone FliJ
MKGYSFRLGTVLRVRNVESLLARQRVGMAARGLAEAIGREKQISETYQASIRLSSEVDGAAFLATRESGERLAAMMASAVVERAKREELLGAKRLEAVQAERRVAVLERLDERRRREWLLSEQREDVAVLDDFATVRAAGGAIEAAGVN